MTSNRAKERLEVLESKMKAAFDHIVALKDQVYHLQDYVRDLEEKKRKRRAKARKATKMKAMKAQKAMKAMKKG